jgi:hypothetical protein
LLTQLRAGESLVQMTYYGRKINIVLKKIELLFCSFPPACLVGESIACNPIDAIPDLSENQVIVLRSGWEARR